MVFMFSRRKKCQECLSKSRKRIFTTVNSHINSSESNNLNTSNGYIVIGKSKLPHINVHTKSSFNKLFTLKRETDTESSIGIHDEMIDEKNTSEEISSHKNSTEVNDHTCDDNRIFKQYKGKG